MNKTKIEWVRNSDGTQGYTWNPLSGCLHGCEYCYARQFATRFKGSKAWPNGFEPTWHPERLKEPTKVKKPNKIFVGSTCDLFGDWVSCTRIREILDVCKECEQHEFIFLTKNPKRYGEFEMPENSWIGTSISNFNKEGQNRIVRMEALDVRYNKFISIEPIQDHINTDALELFDWVIVGAETGNRKDKIVPKKEWIRHIIDSCKEQNVPLFLKNNLNWPEKIQEFPTGM